MKFHELVKRDNIPTKIEILGSTSNTQQIDPTMKMAKNIFPVLHDLYYPNLANSKFLL